MRTTRTDPPDLLVVVFLRGGADGLTLRIPHGDPSYGRHREHTSIGPPESGESFDLDGFFALPSALQPLWAHWNEGHLALLPASGFPGGNRSHFVTQAMVESGSAEPAAVRSGWIARHLAAVDRLPDSPIRGLSLDPFLPRSLFGAGDVAVLTDPAMATFLMPTAGHPGLRDELASLHADCGEPLQSAARNALAALDLARRGGASPSPEETSGPADDDIQSWHRSVGSLCGVLDRAPGLEVATLDFDGWDTHAEQGGARGTIFQRLHHLAIGLARILEAARSFGRPPLVIVMTEFGRRVAENASRGTDHGLGGTMLLLGPGVAGGRVIHRWPGLSRTDLAEGKDVEITIDVRDVLIELLIRRLGNPRAAEIFPDHTAREVGVAR